MERSDKAFQIYRDETFVRDNIFKMEQVKFYKAMSENTFFDVQEEDKVKKAARDCIANIKRQQLPDGSIVFRKIMKEFEMGTRRR